MDAFWIKRLTHPQAMEPRILMEPKIHMLAFIKRMVHPEYGFIDVCTLASEVHSYMHLSVNFNDSPILDGEVVITPDNKLAYQRHKLDRPHDRRRHNLELLYYIELKIPPSDSTIKK